MKYERVALALANAAKENKEGIVWIEEYYYFLFLIVQHDIQ